MLDFEAELIKARRNRYLDISDRSLSGEGRSQQWIMQTWSMRCAIDDSHPRNQKLDSFRIVNDKR